MHFLRPGHQMYDMRRWLGVLSVVATLAGIAFIWFALEGTGPFQNLPMGTRFLLAPTPFVVVFVLRQIAGRIIGPRCPYCDARLTMTRLAWGRAEMRAHYACTACGKWRESE